MNNSIVGNRLRPLIAAVLGSALFSIIAATPAAAAPQDSPPTLTVRYADLDISQPQGAQMLYQRIRSAAQELCSTMEPAGMEFAGGGALGRPCVQKAIANAVMSVDKPELSAVYAATRPAVSMRRVASL